MDLFAEADSRLRPPVHRAGGDRRRRLRRARRQRLHHQHAPRPRTLHRQGPRPAADDGRDHRPRRPATAAARAAACTSPRCATACSAPTRSSPARVADRHRRGRTRCGCRARTPCVVSFFGDGASNQGIFHEAANLAVGARRAGRLRLREQPLGDLDAVPAGRQRCRDIAIRAAGYGFPGEVGRRQRLRSPSARSAERAVARARAGDGPTLIEAKTLPDHAALGGDPDGRPRPRGARALARARPDRPLRRRARRAALLAPSADRRDRGARRSARWRRRPTARWARRSRTRTRR